MTKKFGNKTKQKLLGKKFWVMKENISVRSSKWFDWFQTRIYSIFANKSNKTKSFNIEKCRFDVTITYRYLRVWKTRVSDPDPYPDPHVSGLIWVAGSESGSAFKLLIRIQEGKNDPQKYKKSTIFMFLSTGCSLLRAEGFSCSLGVLYGGLGISKLQFFIKKIEIKFPAIYFFFNFRSSNPGSRIQIRN